MTTTWTLSRTMKNTLVVGGITLFTNLSTDPMPSIVTLYRALIAGMLAALLSYEKQDKENHDQVSGPMSHLLDLIPKRRK